MSTHVGVGAGDGTGVGYRVRVGFGDGTLPSFHPPPQAQHMSAAVKSESSFQAGQDEGEYDVQLSSL